MSEISNRPTAELVVLILAVFIGATLLLVGAGITILEVARPEADYSAAVDTFVKVLTVLLGVVIGYVTGRAGRHATNAPAATNYPEPPAPSV